MQQFLSEWFPFFGQMSPSLKGLCSIVFATVVALSVVVYVLVHSRKNRGSDAQ